MSEAFKKEIIFYPSWDKRAKDPSKNYGVHGVEMGFYLTGEFGAVQFKLSTGWMLKSLRTEKPEWYDFTSHEPMASDLGYHSKTPQYEGQKKMSDKCELLHGPCYYDGSGLEAERIFQILIEKGSEGVWASLEEYYNDVFIKKDVVVGFGELLERFMK